MVCGGISYMAGWRATNSPRYITEILDLYILSFSPCVSDIFVLLQDKARAHDARCIADYLKTARIRMLEWPANSSDLNPIEHLWDLFKMQPQRLEHPPQTELRHTQVCLWEELSQDAIHDIISRMHRHCQIVILARGGHTRN